MPRSLRVLAATACLAGIAAPPAMADFACEYHGMTGGQELYWAQTLAWATDQGGGYDSENRCMSDEKVHLSVKGDLKEGEIVAVQNFPDTDECSWSPSNGPPRLGNYYRGSDGTLSVPICSSPPPRVVVEAYMQQKAALEWDARNHPRDLTKQMELARFFVGWNDPYRAGPAVAKVAELAPGAAETRLLEARLLLLARDDAANAYKRALDTLTGIESVLPIATLLAERTRSEITFEAQRQPNGGFPEGATLPAITVPGLDLSGRDLTGTWLPDAKLADLVAPGSDWTAAGLADNDLSRANLQQAIFTESNLKATKLAGADLQRSRFTNAILVGADFTGAQMQLAVLVNVRAGDARFKDVDLRGAEVDGDFGGADFTSADLRGADLREAGLEGTVLTGVRYDCNTRFPRGFRPELRGMVFADKSVCIGGEQAGK